MCIHHLHAYHLKYILLNIFRELYVIYMYILSVCTHLVFEASANSIDLQKKREKKIKQYIYFNFVKNNKIKYNYLIP